MLCSIPATKSGSRWLDRLRSNKGFPSAENLHLDDILSRPTNSSSEFSPANASASTESTRPHASSYKNPTGDNNHGDAFLGLMSGVLSELFFMDGAGESLKLSGKKIPRKQTNPRVCVNSNSNGDIADGGADNENVVDIDKSRFEENDKELENVGGELECEEEEMRGYSMSEVTVIDTSCGVWKTDKVVFRRKNVWKVREKKAKVKSFWRHKRKVGKEEVNGDIDKKKAKVSVSGLEEADHGDVALKSTEGQNSQNDTSKEVSEGMPDNPNDRGEFGKCMRDNKSKDIRKGFRLNRLPRKLKKGDSSVVVIKGISTDNRNGGKLHRKSLKDSQEQYKT